MPEEFPNVNHEILRLTMESMFMSIIVSTLAGLLDRQHPGLLDSLIDSFDPDKTSSLIQDILAEEFGPLVRREPFDEIFKASCRRIHNSLSKRIGIE